jgi:hypothetical protein
MPHKVKIGTDGTVQIGGSFYWDNDSNKLVEVTHCENFLTQSSYSVSPQGETLAQVRSDISPGSYTYTVKPNSVENTPKMTVTS